MLVQLLASFLFLPSHALHESHIGIVDWHKSLIGVPLTPAAVTGPTISHSTLNTGQSGDLYMNPKTTRQLPHMKTV